MKSIEDHKKLNLNFSYFRKAQNTCSSMIQKLLIVAALGLSTVLLLTGCNRQPGRADAPLSVADSILNNKIKAFVTVKLTTDLSKLSEKEKQMIPLLIEAATIMDDLYWEQVIGSRQQFTDSILNPFIKDFALIN